MHLQLHSIKKREILPRWKNSSSQLFSENITFTKFLRKNVKANFSDLYTASVEITEI